MKMNTDLDFLRRLRLLAVLAASLATLSPARAIAQRGPRQAPPSGQEVAAAARSAKLDRAHARSDQLKGKRLTMTPADLSGLKDPAEFEAGQVIGELETELAGDETGLPPGKYTLYAAKLPNGWHVYAEANGQLVKEAVRVTLEQRPHRMGPIPEFHPKGYGYSVSWCTWSVKYDNGWFQTDLCYAYATRTYDVTVAPQSAAVGVGQATQFSATLTTADTGTYYAGNPSTQDITSAATWATGDPAIATVDNAGMVRGVAVGTTTVKASYTAPGTTGTAWGQAQVSVVTMFSAQTIGTLPPKPVYPVLSFYW